MIYTACAGQRSHPISNLTNRLSTSRERQKGFIPESTGRTADRLHKCSLREQHAGRVATINGGSHRRRLPWNIHSKLRSRRRHLDVNHDGGRQALISYSWLSITDGRSLDFFPSPSLSLQLIADRWSTALMADQNEYGTIYS